MRSGDEARVRQGIRAPFERDAAILQADLPRSSAFPWPTSGTAHGGQTELKAPSRQVRSTFP